MKRTLIAILLALVLVLIPVGSAFAANPVTVSVTATPYILSLAVSPGDWTINGEYGGDSLIRPNTDYYTNPNGDETAPAGANVVDGECRFTFTNDGTVDIDITCDMYHFVGGDAMQNIGTGFPNNGANSYGASGYASGAAWPGGAVAFANAGSGIFINALTISSTIMWGVALQTQTGAFLSATAMTSTINCTATED